MGDDGIPYDPVRSELIQGMRRLVTKAQVITPNFTEACFLLEHEYIKQIESRELKQWLVRLSELGPSVVVVTSVPVACTDHSSGAGSQQSESSPCFDDL